MTIYLDNSATTRVRPEVVEAMLEYLNDHFGNPSSIHSLGRDSYKAVAMARQNVAGLLGCSPTEIYFSSCGTMSNNAAILGRARFVEANDGGRHLITTSIEHPSVIGPARYLESQGWKVTCLPVDSQGLVKVADLEEALTGETSIVSIMLANNEVGSIQPIQEMGAAIKKASEKQGREVFFHTDAIQAAGKVKLDVGAMGVAALSISGHKFHAPKGVGALYLRKGVNIMPITFGGGQEKGLLPGTEGLPNIVGLGTAARLAGQELDENIARLRSLQEMLINHLEPIEGVTLTGPRDLDKRLPGHVSVAVANAEGEALVMQLDLKGICVSSASACHKGIIEPSHVLTALAIPCNMLKGSVRISAGRFTTKEDCEKACRIMTEIFSAQKPAPAARLT